MNIPDYTPFSWPEGTRPTAEQYLDWFLQQSREYQLFAMYHLTESDDIAMRCWRQNHDGLMEEIEYLTQAVITMQGQIGTLSAKQ